MSIVVFQGTSRTEPEDAPGIIKDSGAGLVTVYISQRHLKSPEVLQNTFW